MLWNVFCCCWDFNGAQQKFPWAVPSLHHQHHSEQCLNIRSVQISRKWVHHTRTASFSPSGTFCPLNFKRRIIKHGFVLIIDHLFIKIIRQHLVRYLHLPFRFFRWKWSFTAVHVEQHMKNKCHPSSHSYPPLCHQEISFKIKKIQLRC